MFISKIEIDNYRNFKPSTVIDGVKKGTEVEFNQGTNIIIGHNNAGKTNLLKAIQLVLDSRKAKSKLNVDDFCKEYKNFDIPPEINISLTFKGESENIEPDDHKVLVYDWLTKIEDPYEAKLSFSFFLPQGEDYESYQKEICKFKLNDGSFDTNKVWPFIKKYYFSKYVGCIYGGNIQNKERVNSELLEKFDLQFLDAIRDAEKQMFYGSNTILKDVLNYFLDYDITDGKKLKDLTDSASAILKQRESQFETCSQCLFLGLESRISKDEILKYSKETGADKGGLPNLDAYVSEEDLLFALRLIVQVGQMRIPICNNGLGYNNLLYVALVLAKMQIESESTYYGENSKVFPVLAIEEPEAHLHPSMQFKFLKFLKKNVDVEKKVRQLFITSHSTHITAASDLENIICLYKDCSEEIKVSYPSRAIMNYKNSEINDEKIQNKRNLESKKYIQRFLDATKSNMLFADKVVLVEGLAEQLLLPCFAAYKKIDTNTDITQEDELINQHVCIVSVDSRTFNHFLKLYSFSEENPYAINKKVVCITDADPTLNGKACFPFELYDQENALKVASHVTALKTNFENNFNNIRVFYPNHEGKTLEYEIAKCNASSSLILTSSFPSKNSANTIENFEALQEVLKENPNDYKEIAKKYNSFSLTDNQENRLKCYCNALEKSELNENDKSIALISAIYYNIISSTKGEHSMLLEANLRQNLANEKTKTIFKIPEYIENALTEVLK